MDTDFSVFSIKKSLEEVMKYFDPTKSTYSILKGCTRDDMTAEQVRFELAKIGSYDDYPKEFQSFFYKCFEDLNILLEKDKEIELVLNKIKEKHDIIELEMKKGNVLYKPIFVYKDDYTKMSYGDKKLYLDSLNSSLSTLDDRIIGIKKEKRSGEKFDEKLEEPLANRELMDPVSLDEIEKIQKDSQNNFKIVNNPSLNDVKNYINYFKSNQRENSVLNIKVDLLSGSEIILDIGYKGTEVNEKDSLYRCVYSDVERFYNEIYPTIIEEHIIEGGVKSYNVSNDKLDSENVNGEKLEVLGDQELVINTGNYLDSQVVEDRIAHDELTNKNVKVRKLIDDHNFNSAKANGIIVFVSLVIIILLVILFII